MKKIVIGVTLVSLALIGTVAALPFWEQYRPRPVVVVNDAVRKQTVDALVAQVRDHYVFPAKAAPVETLLRQRQRNGSYDAITDGDKHMSVVFSPEILPPQRQRPSGLPSGPPSNIGYLALSAFPYPQMTAGKYGAAMDKLADTDALVIDLRDNGGGGPTSVALLISYFVDQRTQLNGIRFRDTGITHQLWTEEKLAGKRYGAQKHVAILIGPDTRSAAEDFAYTMQAMGRATLIGARTISPITNTNWGGIGVLPDIAAVPADAMAVAKAHLLRSALGKAGVRPALPVL